MEALAPNSGKALPSLVEGRDYDIQVSARGDTLWVNGNDGSCIGRFSKRFGVDVHRSMTEQMAGAGECVFCTHAPPGPADWDEFRRQVLGYHRINVPADALKF